MSELEFGAWGPISNHIIDTRYGGIAANAYDDHIRQARMMDELGYKYYWIIEHQASYVGSITSPTVFLTAIATATKKIHIGAMIWVLPFHNPMRLAEEVATLDHLSHGRVEFATGIGTHEHEFIRLGLNYDDRQAMGDEALDVIEKAWTQPEVTHHGRFWDFEEMLPRPFPYQSPHPPFWIAAHSMRAFEFAAERNYNVATNISTDDQLVEKFNHFRKVWAECNHPGPMPRQLLVRAVHVAETDEKAREEVEPYLLGSMGLGREMVTNTRVGMGTDPRGKGRDNTRYTRGNGEVFAAARKSYDFWIESGLAVIGSPETVIRQLKDKQDKLGFSVFAANHGIGDMPTDLVDKSITLFGQEVIPAFEQPKGDVRPASLATLRVGGPSHSGMAP